MKGHKEQRLSDELCEVYFVPVTGNHGLKTVAREAAASKMP